MSDLLARLEEGDLLDVPEMLARGLIEPARELDYFERIEPDLHRFPAIDRQAFRRAVASGFMD